MRADRDRGIEGKSPRGELRLQLSRHPVVLCSSWVTFLFGRMSLAVLVPPVPHF